MVLNSYAKINLYLLVHNARGDNYHNITTLFERIDLCDKITLKPRTDHKIKVVCNLPEVPRDNTNLAYRSAELLKKSFQIQKGIEIKITKRIPVGSGLGGGSSNAATVLWGLNKLWKLNLNQKQLVNLAKKIGSDVAFFIYNCPFAQGEGRGDKIRVLRNLKSLRLWHILLVPKINVSTQAVYKMWDKIKHKLTKPQYDVKMLNLALLKKDSRLLNSTLFNSLEYVSSTLYPQISYIKKRLLSLGVKSILMSGSGPAVFGIVSSRKEAIALCRQLGEEGRSEQVLVARTV